MSNDSPPAALFYTQFALSMVNILLAGLAAFKFRLKCKDCLCVCRPKGEPSPARSDGSADSPRNAAGPKVVSTQLTEVVVQQ